MIPREILKRIRQIEIRTNRLVTETPVPAHVRARQMLAQALEIARYAGNNLWHHKTSEGATLQDVIEWYFRWDILKQPFPWNSNPDHFVTRKNPFEIANNHFKLMPEIGDWLKKNRPVNGEQGDEYVTLNRGDLPAPDKR